MVTICVGIATVKHVCSDADVDSAEDGCSHVTVVADCVLFSPGGL